MPLKLIVLMVCVGILASGCTRMMTKDNVSEDRHFRIIVSAEEECHIDIDLQGRDVDVQHGDSTEVRPDGSMIAK